MHELDSASPPAAAPPLLLLGPQRLRPTIGPELRRLLGSRAEAGGAAEVGAGERLPRRRIAVVTAGWQERESEVGELARHLEGAGWEAVPLALHARAEAIFATDPELAAAHRRRQDRLRALQAAYRFQLAHRLEAARALLQERPPILALGAALDPELLDGERTFAVAAVRDLDAHHLERVRRVHREHEERWRPRDREAVARQRRELAELLDDCAALAIAGGHAAVLLNRMRLFGLLGLAAERALPVAAWSAGAMVLAERVVLFHDSPPQGAGNAEILEAGLGVAGGLVPLPHARRRLRLDDPLRVSLLARRLAPEAPVALDGGAWIELRSGEVVGEAQVRRLGTDGTLTPLDPPREGEVEAAGGVAEPGWAGPSSEEAGAVEEDANPAAPPGPPGAAARPLAIRRLEAAVADAKPDARAAAVADFLAAHRFPLQEGTTATFVWLGAAEAVRLKHWIYGLPSTQPFRRLEGTDLWTLALEIPERSRVEYKLEIVRDGEARWIRDPRNPDEARDPFGANSVFHGVGYRPPEWTRPDVEARPGRLEEVVVESRAFGEERRVRVYVPARLRASRRHPLLVVHDGEDYLRYADLGTVLDNLVERLEVAPPVVALTQAGERLVEYADDPRHATFLADELLPRLEERYPLEPGPAGRGLVGASFGAVASLSAAWRRPGCFGRLLLQSGSFAFTDIGTHHGRGEVFDPVVDFMNRFRDAPGRPADRIYLSCGIYESLIYENRSLVPLLQEAGLEVRYREARDGHNWQNWRDRLREGLSWLFPGPLWMVYE